MEKYDEPFSLASDDVERVWIDIVVHPFGFHQSLDKLFVTLRKYHLAEAIIAKFYIGDPTDIQRCCFSSAASNEGHEGAYPMFGFEV